MYHMNNLIRLKQLDAHAPEAAKAAIASSSTPGRAREAGALNRTSPKPCWLPPRSEHAGPSPTAHTR